MQSSIYGNHGMILKKSFLDLDLIKFNGIG
jgi:hypothetical protein